MCRPAAPTEREYLSWLELRKSRLAPIGELAHKWWKTMELKTLLIAALALAVDAQSPVSANLTIVKGVGTCGSYMLSPMTSKAYDSGALEFYYDGDLVSSGKHGAPDNTTSKMLSFSGGCSDLGQGWSSNPCDCSAVAVIETDMTGSVKMVCKVQTSESNAATNVCTGEYNFTVLSA